MNEERMSNFKENFSNMIASISGNKLLLTLRDSFVLVSVTTMIAGFAIMLNSVFLDPFGGLIFGENGLHLGRIMFGSQAAWESSSLANGLSTVGSVINLVTQGSMSIFALFLVIVFAYMVSNNYYPKAKEHMTSILYAVSAFFISIPWNWDYISNGEPVSLSGVINTSFLGTQGVFAALIIGGLSVVMYNKLLGTKLKIKLPEGVPPWVAATFESLIPGTITMLFFAVVTGVLHLTVGQTMPELLLQMIQKPMEFIAGTSAFAFISQFTWSLFMWFGIHPSSIWGAIFGVTWNVNDVQNMAGTGHHLYSTMFMNFSTIAAGTFALAPVLAMMIASKQEGEKEVSKMALMPAIFNISEPITFGLPIIMNPVYLLPFVITQPLCFYIGVFFTKIGFIDVITNNVPWTVPPVISGILFTGSLNGAVVQLVNLAIATAIYLPFVRLGGRIAAQKDELGELV